MLRLLAALLLVAPFAANGGCLSLLDPPDDSGCSRSSAELVWLNPAHLLQRVKLPQFTYDRELNDPALMQGLALKGDVQFELKAPGPQLVEVFLAVDGEGVRISLEAGGRALDDARPAGVRPAGLLRGVTLLGVFSGPFTIRSRSPYVLSAIRWTPQKQFDESLAGRWLDRARQMAADPFFEGLRSARRENLEQLYDRLALSSRAGIRREAVIGRARTAYWLAAKTQRAEDLESAANALRDAFKLAPEDRTVRQMVSAACSETNVRGGRMPYGVYCVDVSPVYWTVPVADDPRGAPEWAVAQKRLAARLEAITAWWVDHRQQANGEIGGGWRDDAGLVRQWGWLALALGSKTASAGLRRFDQGLTEAGEAAGAPPELAREIRRFTLMAAGRPPGTGNRSPHSAGSSGSFSAPLPSEVVWNMAFMAQDSEKALAKDFAMYTSEVIYTDRVYYPVPAAYWRYVLGGDENAADPLAAAAVTFPPSEADYARAVVQSGPSGLRLRLYSFEGKPVQAGMRVWKLEPGAYRWETTDVIGTRVASGSVMITGSPQLVTIPLPPGREIEAAFTRVAR